MSEAQQLQRTATGLARGAAGVGTSTATYFLLRLADQSGLLCGT